MQASLGYIGRKGKGERKGFGREVEVKGRWRKEGEREGEEVNGVSESSPQPSGTERQVSGELLGLEGPGMEEGAWVVQG